VPGRPGPSRCVCAAAGELTTKGLSAGASARTTRDHAPSPAEELLQQLQGVSPPAELPQGAHISAPGSGSSNPCRPAPTAGPGLRISPSASSKAGGGGSGDGRAVGSGAHSPNSSGGSRRATLERGGYSRRYSQQQAPQPASPPHPRSGAGTCALPSAELPASSAARPLAKHTDPMPPSGERQASACAGWAAPAPRLWPERASSPLPRQMAPPRASDLSTPESSTALRRPGPCSAPRPKRASRQQLAAKPPAPPSPPPHSTPDPSSLPAPSLIRPTCHTLPRR
jgi:hypothetical protein